jgi:DNA (cytosine-5)-methyltransferase 1
VNFISLFSGGGGADIGAMMAGYTPVAANEYDPAIAEVYRANIGNHIRVGDILQQDPRTYPACDLLHLSPPCPNFSVAKAGAKETEHDIALAEKAAEFIRVLAPRAVTVENVTVYRDSRSYQIILKAITDGGYMYDAEVLNSADYGVPQTRRRFIVRAVHGLLRPMPAPVRWIGWYEAIADLIDTLPASEFALWQLARLPAELQTSAMFNNQASDDHKGGTYGVTSREESDPAISITNSFVPRAFIVDGNINDGERINVRQSEEPNMTIQATGNKRPYRAFIVDQLNGSHVVPTLRTDNEPIMTVGIHSVKHPAPRAWLSEGRVVKMTPRALARFQSFPDWYQLPEKTALACKIIGNAMPPLLAWHIARTIE